MKLDSFPEPVDSLRAITRRDWRWYAPSWVFPIVALLAITAENAGTLPSAVVQYSLFVLAPIAFFVALVPLLLGRASRGQQTILGILLPVAIWTVGVFIRIAVLSALGRSDLV